MHLIDIEWRLALHHGDADLSPVAICLHQRFARGDRVLLGNGDAHAKRNARNNEHGTDHVMVSPLSLWQGGQTANVIKFQDINPAARTILANGEQEKSRNRIPRSLV